MRIRVPVHSVSRITTVVLAALLAAPLAFAQGGTETALEAEWARLEPLSGGVLGLAAVQLEKSRFRLIFSDPQQVAPADLQRLVHKSSSQLEFKVDEGLTIETFLRASDEQERLAKARDLVEQLL